MADEENSQDKTEQPSAKRLRESRQKGQVARSKDFNAAIILLFSSITFLVLGQYLAEHLQQLMHEAFEFDSDLLITASAVMYKLYVIAKIGFLAVMPVLLIILLLSIAAPLLMGGWVFSLETLQPKFSRLSVLKGLKRMISLKGLVELVKSLVKFLLVAVVSLALLWWKIPALLALANFSLAGALHEGLAIMIAVFLIISASLIIIAAFDVPFQLYQHNKELKMTKQEVRDEYKETEGKPEVKSHIRKTQQEFARRRMMSEVPKANVILTNPTHYAVAIKYEPHGKRAPIVIAKGKDLVALQINRVAAASQVPLLSVPPLTRAIYFSTALNAEIPRGLYVAVAQVLAYIFQLKDKHNYDSEPQALQDLPIPDELKRDAEESV